MDRRKLLRLWLPILVFSVDLGGLFFTPPPPKPSHTLIRYHLQAILNETHNANFNQTQTANLNQTFTANLNQTQNANLNQTQNANLNQTQNANLNRTLAADEDKKTAYRGNTVLINYSSICSYRGAAMSIKLKLFENFGGIHVLLSPHSPAWSKYLVLKLIPVVQIGIIIVVMAGPVIFHALGARTPPWYRPLSKHKFSVIAIPWLLGTIAINYLQNSEAFEIYLNDQLVFCKQLAGRFPGQTELKEFIRSSIPVKG